MTIILVIVGGVLAVVAWIRWYQPTIFFMRDAITYIGLFLQLVAATAIGCLLATWIMGWF